MNSKSMKPFSNSSNTSGPGTRTSNTILGASVLTRRTTSPNSTVTA